MKKLFYLILLLCLMCTPKVHATGHWTSGWGASGSLNGGTGQYLPFWAHTGQNGIVPTTSNALLTLGAGAAYNHSNGFFYESGCNFAGWLASVPNGGVTVNGAVDRLYVSAGWKMLRAELGIAPRQRELGDLSVTGGNMMWTSNARNLPGINVKADWIPIFKWFALRGNVAHYKMNDNRAVVGTMLHNKSLEGKITINSRVSISGGLEHIAQWGGYSERLGAQPSSLGDFVRVFFAMNGGDDALETDKINVLGNHLGREYVRIDWQAERFGLLLQYDKPFEDGSGVRFQNAPDGIWSVQCRFNDRSAFVTDVVLEYVNTTWQSGPEHDRPATKEEMEKQDPNDPYYGRIVLRGCDNYFNNSEYRSGWTNYGRTIGLPLIIAAAPGEDGMVMTFANTRVRAFHSGLKGNLAKGLPYSFKGTFSLNYGKYKKQVIPMFDTRPWQLSLAFELGLKRFMNNVPIDFNVGVYGDVGKLYQNSVGLTLKLSYSDFCRF